MVHIIVHFSLLNCTGWFFFFFSMAIYGISTRARKLPLNSGHCQMVLDLLDRLSLGKYVRPFSRRWLQRVLSSRYSFPLLIKPVGFAGILATDSFLGGEQPLYSGMHLFGCYTVSLILYWLSTGWLRWHSIENKSPAENWSRICSFGASLVAQMVKNLPAMWQAWVWSRSGNPWEKSMAPHSSILSWRIPWTEEPGGLQSMGLQRVRHNWVTNTHIHYSFYRKIPQSFIDRLKLTSALCQFWVFVIFIYLIFHIMHNTCLLYSKNSILS